MKVMFNPMTKKERQKIDSIIHHIRENGDFVRIKKIRQVAGVNSHFNEEDEINYITKLFKDVLEIRKSEKSTYFTTNYGVWNIYYMRKKAKYKKNENFSINLYSSFVDYVDV